MKIKNTINNNATVSGTENLGER